jgi:uroporphyrinogen-III synthase
MRILVTRPEPDATKQVEKLAARGHEGIAAPMLDIELLPGTPLELDGVQALIVTSRNALRALESHPERERAAELPLFAVGEASAFTAQSIGFADVTSGVGTGQALATLIARMVEPESGTLLHISGDFRAFDIKGALEAKGFTVEQALLYRSHPVTELPSGAVAALKRGALDAAIFMSPRTARIFTELAARHGLVTQAKGLVCYCLSQAVAGGLAPLGVRTRIAASPSEEDVLALLDAETASS